MALSEQGSGHDVVCSMYSISGCRSMETLLLQSHLHKTVLAT